MVLVHKRAVALQGSEGKERVFLKDPSLSPLAIFILDVELKTGAPQEL